MKKPINYIAIFATPLLFAACSQAPNAEIATPTCDTAAIVASSMVETPADDVCPEVWNLFIAPGANNNNVIVYAGINLDKPHEMKWKVESFEFATTVSGDPNHKPDTLVVNGTIQLVDAQNHSYTNNGILITATDLDLASYAPNRPVFVSVIIKDPSGNTLYKRKKRGLMAYDPLMSEKPTN